MLILSQLKVGDQVHDMHYFLTKDEVKELFGKNATVASKTTIDTANAHNAVLALVGQTEILYLNKMLVFVGMGWSLDHGTTYQFAYSYDNIRFGLVTIVEDHTPPK